MHLFVEHLTVIDSAYLCEQHGLVGESWITDIALIGTLDANSMVMDFGHVKKRIKQAIDAWVDHTLIVPTLSPNLTLRHPELGSGSHEMLNHVQHDEACTLTFSFSPPTTHHSPFTLSHQSPTQALCLIEAPRITPDAIATYLEARLMEVVPETVERIEVTLRTEPGTEPYYHYVHGLKKHDGNCQRIAHGHRSRIRIARNGAHDAALTTAWAARLAYTYIGTRADVTGTDATHTHFAYTAPQGSYALSYPTALCHLIDTDSTVECIAQHIAIACKAESPRDTFTVRAYEGVMKGAIASA